MLKAPTQHRLETKTLSMPDQDFQAGFKDALAPGLAKREIPVFRRLVLLGLPLGVFITIISLLFLAFNFDNQLSSAEIVLIGLMALLSGWGAIPTANALLGVFSVSRHPNYNAESSLKIAILIPMRDEDAQTVIPGKLALLQSLLNVSRHIFSCHVISDSMSAANIAEEQGLVLASAPLPVFHYHRRYNTDFKSGNIRNWIETQGAPYDAVIILDADSEMEPTMALELTNSLGQDPACGLVQTIPVILPGHTYWQHMQSIASRHYGQLQGQGLASWTGDEANYYGHNAIIRTQAFAACAGLPQLSGRGLWKGTILSHDFVEAALLRRAGWAVRLLPSTSGSFEQAPTDAIAHLKRDERWCLGNFQHSRIVAATGLHPLSRLHFLSGIFSYLSSLVWLMTLLLWMVLDTTQTDIGDSFATMALALIAGNLFLPRFLGSVSAIAAKPRLRWQIVTAVVTETIFSSVFAPSLMLQRVMIIGRVLTNRPTMWTPHDKANRNLVDYGLFHMPELLTGLALLALIEHGALTTWFLPLGICLAVTPVLSYVAAQARLKVPHEKLNAPTSL
jgi:membrane glycosyltransferase